MKATDDTISSCSGTDITRCHLLTPPAALKWEDAEPSTAGSRSPCPPSQAATQPHQSRLCFPSQHRAVGAGAGFSLLEGGAAPNAIGLAMALREPHRAASLSPWLLAARPCGSQQQPPIRSYSIPDVRTLITKKPRNNSRHPSPTLGHLCSEEVNEAGKSPNIFIVP